MKFLQKIFDWIEVRRGTKNPLFFILIVIKDILWFFSYFIPTQIIKLLQNKTQKSLLFFYGFFDHYRVPVERYYKISFCITCMDRLSHLKKTLRKNIENNRDYPNVEFVLLDYNSSDELEEWVFYNFVEELKSGLLIYYKTDESKYFQMARAKNIAHQIATGDIVCNLDADNYTGKDFAFYINLTCNQSMDIIGVQKYDKRFLQSHISDCGGRIFLSKDNFLKLGGYNEKFVGWGKEDREFIARAGKLGLKEEYIPRYFLGAIRHSNWLRVKNMVQSIKQADDNNEFLLQKSYNSQNFKIDNPVIEKDKIRRMKLKGSYLLSDKIRLDEVWVITTFFNPQNNRQRLDNYHTFQKNLRRQGIKLLTVEVVFKNSWFSLRNKDADLLVSVKSDSVLWQKERLLNIALKHLPPYCRYVVWADADVIFLNDNWLENTVELLQKYPVVQCFSEAVYLNKDENWREEVRNGFPKERRIESFASYYQKKLDKKPFFETAGGFAWAARKEVLDKVGFYDYNILGGGDWKMIEAFISADLKNKYEIEWAEKINKIVLGKIVCVPGLLLHLYHGELKNRLYGTRQTILDKHGFNPERDLELNHYGCWRFTKQAPKNLKKDISLYFRLRNEKNQRLTTILNSSVYKKNPDLNQGDQEIVTLKSEFEHNLGLVGIFLRRYFPRIYNILKRK